MKPIDLIATARDLVPNRPGAPRESDLRRALSTAYYALFHCLASTCADTLMGTTVRNSPAWIRVYRALSHATARNQCRRTEVDAFPATVGVFANAFGNMQIERHQADYAPDKRPRKSEVLLSIDRAENAIRALESEALQTRRAFAAYVLFRSR